MTTPTRPFESLRVVLSYVEGRAAKRGESQHATAELVLH